jgi:hypothetical protein
MVDIVKGGGRARPRSPAWADFTLMMECTPESGNCYSVYSVFYLIPLMLAGTGRQVESRLGNEKIPPLSQIGEKYNQTIPLT